MKPFFALLLVGISLVVIGAVLAGLEYSPQIKDVLPRALVVNAPSRPYFEETSKQNQIFYLQHDAHRRPEAPSETFDALNYGSYFMSGGVATGDINNDGLPDVFATIFDNRDRLYINNGDGTFSDQAEERGIPKLNSNGVALADVDNDADLDIYITTVYDSTFHLFINDGLGNFTEETSERNAGIETGSEHFGFSVSFGDYNNDGYVDLHTTEWKAQPSNSKVTHTRLLQNLGAERPGHFIDVTDAAGVAVENLPTPKGWDNSVAPTFYYASQFVDLDNDTYADLLLTGDFNTSKLFWNNGDGTFTLDTKSGFGTAENASGITTADINNDGLLDIFVSSIYDENNTCEQYSCRWNSSGNRLYQNLGDRIFADVTDGAGVRAGGWGWGASFLDFDNDGDLDLVQANGVTIPNEAVDGVELDAQFNTEQMHAWEKTKSGFKDKTETIGFTTTKQGKGLAVFDYDADGDLDVFIANNADSPSMYTNLKGAEQSWLRVVSKRPGALPARVSLYTESDAGPIVRIISANSTYLGQSEPVAHFGLGTKTDTIDRITIEWSDGVTDERKNIPIDSVLTFGLLGAP